MKKSTNRHTIASYMQRPVERRELLPLVLIVCEGERTEPNYFEALKADLRVSVNVEVIGLGQNTDSLVERTIELSQEDSYSAVWCVFDRDSFPAGRFNRAIQLAESNGIKVAYSNECFELWYLLHFEYLTSACSRHDYPGKLTRYLSRKYDKRDRFVYRDTRQHLATAIRNSKRLLTIHNTTDVGQHNPSTTVHLLVEALQTYHDDRERARTEHR